MYIQVKTSSGITMVPMESKLLDNRKVFLEGDIDSEKACEFIKKIMLLIYEDAELAIDVYINTCGGDINSGLLIYDAIQGSPAPIRTICMGKAYSMGAILLASGRERWTLPHGKIMIHEPLVGGVEGSSSSIKSISESLLNTTHIVNDILSRHTNRSVEEITKATEYDHYFNAEEAVSFGLCDRIIDFSEIMEVSYV